VLFVPGTKSTKARSTKAGSTKQEALRKEEDGLAR
jgi:hypothetical protein